MITTYRYKFTVQWVPDETEETVSSIERGYVFGRTYMDALEHLVDMYGEEQIENINLALDGDNDIVVLEDDMKDFNVDWEGPAVNYF